MLLNTRGKRNIFQMLAIFGRAFGVSFCSYSEVVCIAFCVVGLATIYQPTYLKFRPIGCDLVNQKSESGRLLIIQKNMTSTAWWTRLNCRLGLVTAGMSMRERSISYQCLTFVPLQGEIA